MTVEGPDLQACDTLAALFEAGLGDATIARREGVQTVEVCREAPSAAEALAAALLGLNQAVPHASVVRVDVDLEH